METIKITRLEQAVLEYLASGFTYKLIIQAHDLTHVAYYDILKSLKVQARFNAKTTTHLVAKYKDLKALGKIEVLDEAVQNAS